MCSSVMEYTPSGATNVDSFSIVHCHGRGTVRLWNRRGPDGGGGISTQSMVRRRRWVPNRRMTPRILHPLRPQRSPPTSPLTSTMLSPRQPLLRTLRALPRLQVCTRCTAYARHRYLTFAKQHTSRRWSSTEPPPAGGHSNVIGTSSFLKPTRDVALRTQGLQWIDPVDSDPSRDMVGRETRKMNMYQAVRDALRYPNSRCSHHPPLVPKHPLPLLAISIALRLARTTPP